MCFALSGETCSPMCPRLTLTHRFGNLQVVQEPKLLQHVVVSQWMCVCALASTMWPNAMCWLLLLLPPMPLQVQAWRWIQHPTTQQYIWCLMFAVGLCTVLMEWLSKPITWLAQGVPTSQKATHQANSGSIMCLLGPDQQQCLCCCCCWCCGCGLSLPNRMQTHINQCMRSAKPLLHIYTSTQHQDTIFAHRDL